MEHFTVWKHTLDRMRDLRHGYKHEDEVDASRCHGAVGVRKGVAAPHCSATVLGKIAPRVSPNR